jgi:vitamin B12 transporter
MPVRVIPNQLRHTVLRHTVLRHTVLRHTVLRHTVLRHTVLRHTVLRGMCRGIRRSVSRLVAVGRFVLPVATPLALHSQSAGGGAVPPTAASSARDVVLRGRVARIDQRPIASATVYLLETLEETRTDSTGRFELRSTHRGLATVVARAVGFIPATIDIQLPSDSVVTLSLTAQPPVLGVVAVVAAGEYTLGSGQTATLSPLEVAQTPGAAANVARAIQTLPGAQNVDEGTGVFVRGGDVTETRVLIDDAWMLSPVRFDNPTGHVTSTINPFLLSRTVFSSGGFGARHGNALSGLIRMETADAPTRATASLSASIGSLSASAGVRPHPRIGVLASAGVTTLAPLVSVFGEAQPYDPAPRGGNASAAIEWTTSRAGRVRLFGVRQASRFGVGEASETGQTRYGASTDEDMAVLSWRDSSTR